MRRGGEERGGGVERTGDVVGIRSVCMCLVHKQWCEGLRVV